MRYQLKSDLLKNHDIDNNLLNVDRIRSRASSLDILYSFNEDENEVYLYDFIAYLQKKWYNIKNRKNGAKTCNKTKNKREYATS